MEEKYDLALEWFYFNLGKFKEAQINRMKNILGGSRIGSQMKFSSYGYAYFEKEDHKHSHLIVEPISTYDKNKVNCIIYNLEYNCQNTGFYDKLFIYINQLKETYYGYVLYNSETKHSSQKTLIDLQEDYVINNLVKDFNTLFKKDIFDFHSKKYDAIKQFRKNNKISIPTVGEYKEVIRKHKEKQKIGYY